LNILTDKTVQHSKQLEQVSKLLDKIVKKHSLEGFWHWLRFKEVRKQRTRVTQFKGTQYEVQWVNDWYYVFEPRRWYNTLRRIKLCIKDQ
jgi:hypothetical protein